MDQYTISGQSDEVFSRIKKLRKNITNVMFFLESDRYFKI